MADEPKKIAKKPPAHEVILKRLQELERVIRRLWDEIDAPNETAKYHPGYISLKGSKVAALSAAFMEQLSNLQAMHLPESERPAIYEALRTIDIERTLRDARLCAQWWEILIELSRGIEVSP